MSERSQEPGKKHGDPIRDIIEDRRAEGQDEHEGHVAGPEESSYTDNPTFAAGEGESRDVSGGELDYVEEPGVGGVSGDQNRGGGGAGT